MSFPREFPRSLALLGLAIALLIGVSSVYALRQARAAGGAPLLPHLVADPPDKAVLGTSSVEGSSRLLLRFNGYIHNVGPGAVDFRGSREKPKVSKATEEQVEHARENQEGLPQKTEEELASPPMKVFQRLFTTNVGQEETNIERAHVDEGSSSEIIYASADGHHHWHLQKVAKYSLWNASKTAEVAPAQKVGFCLDDSQHVESNVGPSSPVYADKVPPFRDFCQQYRPNATSLFEGISPGWRDVYDRELAFQWVDASNVLPGEYWLREDVNPLGVVKEMPGAKIPVYSTSSTTIPGFDAQPQSINATGEPQTITLHSLKYEEKSVSLAAPRYRLVAQPQHGTVSELTGPNKDQLIYTPDGRYSGPDSLTFSAEDPNSEFPESPAIASVSIEGPEPAISISGGPAEMIASTSVSLTAVTNDHGGVEWEKTSGTVVAEGPEGRTGLFTAPAAAGTATITARLKDDHAVSASQTITIKPVPPNEPATEVPSAAGASSSPAAAPSSGATSVTSGSGGTQGFKTVSPPPGLARPRAMLFGRKLVMSTFATAPGRVRLSAYLGRERVGSCAASTPAGRTFTCRLVLGPRISLRARIRVLASLRIDSLIFRSSLPAEQIPQMKMKPAGLSAHASSAGGQFWCSPSTLVPTLSSEG